MVLCDLDSARCCKCLYFSLPFVGVRKDGLSFHMCDCLFACIKLVLHIYIRISVYPCNNVPQAFPSEKGECFSSLVATFAMSVLSLSIRDSIASLCCSLLANTVSVKSCIA